MALLSNDATPSARRSVRRRRTTTSRPDASTRKTEERDAPSMEELRRSRVEYYSLPASERMKTGLRPMVQELQNRVEKTENRTSSVRHSSSRSGKRLPSGRSQHRKVRKNGVQEEDGFVYGSHRTERRSRQSQSSDTPVASPSRHNDVDDESQSQLSDEGLRSGTPPPAPDPPNLTPLSSRVPSLSSAEKSTRSHRTRSSVFSGQKASTRPSPSTRQGSNKVKRRRSEPPLPVVSEVKEPAAPRRQHTYTEQAPQDKEKDRRKSFAFGSLFSTSKLKSRAKESPALMECLICTTEVPSAQAALLRCGHVMCHSCLKRLFTMSLTDPQHMPPRCCPTDEIPLKYVDKLFDSRFKARWKQKYTEYSTKNRLYCPTRGCGTWIAPQSIHQSAVDAHRSIGTCPKCNRKTCASCGRKWHTNSDCEARNTDVNAKEFAKMAAASGWKTCYNCTATVELKEGCNHMTCRCGAQFCMICGTKWKGCDCPWFNYQAVNDADRFIRDAARIVEATGRRPFPGGYAAEIQRRHDQEQRDEEIARRMQGLELSGDLDDGDGSRTPTMEREWGGNDTFGFGRMAGHFLNDDFVIQATRILTGTVNRQNREAADRLVAEIRGERTPPLPGSAFIAPFTRANFPPRGQESGVVEADEPTHGIYTRATHRRRTSRYETQETDEPDFVEAPEVEPGDGKDHRIPRVPVNHSDVATDGRRRSVLAGLATTPGQRVQQWVQHVDGEDA